MKVEVAVLGSPSLIVLVVSVDVKREDDEEFELSVANIHLSTNDTRMA